MCGGGTVCLEWHCSCMAVDVLGKRSSGLVLNMSWLRVNMKPHSVIIVCFLLTFTESVINA